jgi:hypothetical protein
MDFSSAYPSYIVRRSCFAKRFSKTDSTTPHNPLHRHSHNQSCHNRSRSPTKRTLSKPFGVNLDVNNVLSLDSPSREF